MSNEPLSQTELNAVEMAIRNARRHRMNFVYIPVRDAERLLAMANADELRRLRDENASLRVQLETAQAAK